MTNTDKFSTPPETPSEDDDWERAFEPDAITSQLPRPIDMSPTSAAEQADDDWLSSVAAQPSAKADDWLSQFAVIENPIEPTSQSTDDLARDDSNTPAWMRDTERTGVTAEESLPVWMRDTERANVVADVSGEAEDFSDTNATSDAGNEILDADTDRLDRETIGGKGQPHSGMTGLLNAIVQPKSEPTYSGNTDILDAQTLPDWMTAFTDEALPEKAEPVEPHPELDTMLSPALELAPTPVSSTQASSPPPKPLDLSGPTDDELFDAQAIPDWLSALAPAGTSVPSVNPEPEPETEILDLRNDEAGSSDIDIDNLLSGTADVSLANDVENETIGEAQIPAWMREIAPAPTMDVIPKLPSTAQVEVIVAEHEAEPAVESEAAIEPQPTVQSTGGFTFNRKPAWLTIIKK